MKTVLKSSRIYTEDGVISGSVVINDGIIEALGQYHGEGNVIDFGHMRIIPGIFDSHNHGTHGYNVVAVEEGFQEEYVEKYLKAMASQGVTGVFPTCDVDMVKAVRAVASRKPEGSAILGIHCEDPWLNRVGEKGIKTGWGDVNVETAKKMVKDGDGMLRVVALAPEIPGIGEIIEYFKSEGVTLAFAHSEDNYEEAKKHLEQGFTVATHLANVMSGLHHRDVGGLGACLLNDNMDYEIICDGMHVSLPMVKILFMIRDYSKFMMISDNSGMAGAPMGRYQGWSFPVIVTEEGFILTDTGRIYCSSKPILYGMYNLVEKLNIPLETVIKMSALNPSRKYGFDKKKGSLAIGKDADIVIIDDSYKALQTYVDGKKVYDSMVDTDLFNPEFLRKYKLD